MYLDLLHSLDLRAAFPQCAFPRCTFLRCSLPHTRFRNATFPQFSESLGLESVCIIVVVFVRRPLDHVPCLTPSLHATVFHLASSQSPL